MSRRTFVALGALALAAAAACEGLREAPDDAGAPDAGSESDADTDTTRDGAGGGDVSPGSDGATTDGAPACGAAGESCCASGAPCATGLDCIAGKCACEGGLCAPEKLGDSPLQPTIVVVDATNVTWFDESGSGAIFTCPKSGCGGAPTKLAEGFQTTGIASDGTSIYWGDFSAGKIQKCALAGCAQLPTTLVFGQTSAEGLTFDGTNLYWGASLDAGAVMTCPAAGCGGAPKLIADGQGFVLVTAAENGAAYWTIFSPKKILGCAAGGCANAPRKIADTSAASLTVVGGNVYFIDTANHTIAKCPSTGCTGAPTVLGTSSGPAGIACDGVDVYWRDQLDSNLYACPVSGCGSSGARLVAKNWTPGSIAGIAVDGQYVYFTAESAVWRVPK